MFIEQFEKTAMKIKTMVKVVGKYSKDPARAKQVARVKEKIYLKSIKGDNKSFRSIKNAIENMEDKAHKAAGGTNH